MDTRRKHIDRKFGYSILEWKIENYCLLTPFNQWKICSPKFYVGGILKTIWRMTLIKGSADSKDVSCAYFKLTMLGIEECEKKSRNLAVESKLHFKNQYGGWSLLNDNYSFKPPSVETLELNLHGFNPSTTFHSKDLIIKCELLIRFDDYFEEISPCYDLGFKNLSDDMYRLLRTKSDSNVVLKIDTSFSEYPIKAHKQIVCSRNSKLSRTLSLNDTAVEFVIAHSDNTVQWEKIISFLYTGNMEHILDVPMLEFYDTALAYDIQPILAYYAPDEVQLHSLIHAEEFFVAWTVHNYLDRGEICLSSPLMKNETSDTTWQLKLYPRSFANERNTCLCFEITSRKMKIVLMEFRLKNNSDDQDYIKHIHDGVKRKETLKGYVFIEREQLNNYLQNGSLIVVIKLHMINWDNFSDWRVSAKLSIGKSVFKCMPYWDQMNYVRLSEDMLDLYETNNSDRVSFIVENEKYSIHRCILTTRLPSLYRCIKENMVVNFPNVKPSSILSLIRFLYCGRLDPLPVEDMLELYQIAVKFNSNSLRASIEDYFKRCFNILEMEDKTKVYEFACSKGSSDLNANASEFIPVENDQR